jgi:predicted phage tail protein
VDGADPTIDGPYSDYEPGVDDDTSRDPEPVQVKRFTMNVAIAKQEKAVDVLFKKLLPSFRGYLTFSKEGKIQIRCERPVPNTTASANSDPGATEISAAPAGIVAGDLALVSPFTASAEALTVQQVLADRLRFTTETGESHLLGDQILRIAMVFDDSNIVGGFQYPLSDRQSSINRVTIKYVDAPAGFEERELRINDYEHQERVHKVNNEDLDGSAIDSYCQAWRIGQWRRAKLRDLGKFCSFRADIKASARGTTGIASPRGRWPRRSQQC